MSKDTEKTVVIFRKYKNNGDILALFPELPWSGDSNVTSYEHMGQHGAADYNHCLDITKPAKPEEYAALKKELENQVGYNLEVKSKRMRNKS